MKTKFLLVFSIWVLISWMPFIANSATAASEIRLRAVSHFPPVSAQAKLTGEFCKEVEKRTNGLVRITYYPGGSLLDATRIYGGIVQGIADLGNAGLHFTMGRFPVMETTYLPIGFTSGWVATHVVSDYYWKLKPKEFDDVHVLLFHACGPNLLITRQPVQKLDDVKGRAIRATGRVAQVVEALGATARPMEISEGYDAASRGLLDGFALPFEATKNWKLADVTRYITDCWQIGSTYTFVLAMNKNTWNMLPPEIQKVFTELSQEYIEKHALMQNDIDIEGARYGLEKGMNVIELPPQEADRWTKATDKVVDAYMKERVAAGFSSEDVKSQIRFLKELIDRSTKKQKELGIKSMNGPEEIRMK